MSEVIAHGSLPEGWQPQNGRRPALAREAEAAMPGAEATEASRQAVATAVVAGLTASPGTPAATAAAAVASRTRHAAMVARASATAGQALAALARSVRAALNVEDVERGSEAGLDDATPDGGTTAVALPLDLGPRPAWLPPGGTGGQRGSDGMPVQAAKGRTATRAAGGTMPRDPRLPPPPLTSTAAIVRVRAPQRVQRAAKRRYAALARIVSWGVALACTLALASAYWLVASPPSPEDGAQEPASEEAAPDGR